MSQIEVTRELSLDPPVNCGRPFRLRYEESAAVDPGVASCHSPVWLVPFLGSEAGFGLAAGAVGVRIGLG